MLDRLNINSLYYAVMVKRAAKRAQQNTRNKMKTTINDTTVIVEMGGYDKHLHGEYLKASKKPFRVAYITLKTENPDWGDNVPEEANPEFNAKLITEHGGPDTIWQIAGDTFLVFVDIDMIDNISPKLKFSIVNRENDWDRQFADHNIEYAEQVLEEFADAVRYHEI